MSTPQMSVAEARTWAEGAQRTLATPSPTYAPDAMPKLVEALAVLGRQEHAVKCQLNATKTRLQALTALQRTAAAPA